LIVARGGTRHGSVRQSGMSLGGDNTKNHRSATNVRMPRGEVSRLKERLEEIGAIEEEPFIPHGEAEIEGIKVRDGFICHALLAEVRRLAGILFALRP